MVGDLHQSRKLAIQIQPGSVAEKHLENRWVVYRKSDEWKTLQLSSSLCRFVLQWPEYHESMQGHNFGLQKARPRTRDPLSVSDRTLQQILEIHVSAHNVRQIAKNVKRKDLPNHQQNPHKAADLKRGRDNQTPAWREHQKGDNGADSNFIPKKIRPEVSWLHVGQMDQQA